MEVASAALPYRIFSGSTADDLRTRLEGLNETLYRTKEGASIETLMKEYLLDEEYKHIKSYAEDHGISMNSSQSTQEYVDAIIGAIDACESLVCKVAFRPRGGFVKEVMRWFAENIDGYARVTFVYTPEILAGLVIEYQGKIYDHSFRRQLVEAKMFGYGSNMNI